MSQEKEPAGELVLRISSSLWNAKAEDAGIAETASQEDACEARKKSFHGYGCPHCGAGVGFNAKRCKTCRKDLGRPVEMRTLIVAKEKAQRGQAMRRGKQSSAPGRKKGGKQMKPQAAAPHAHKPLTVTFGGMDPIRVRPDPAMVKQLVEQPMIRELRALLENTPRDVLDQPVTEDQQQACLSAVFGMTYRELVQHLISLRVEQVQRLLRPVVQRLLTHPINHNTFNVAVDPVKLNIPDYYQKIKNPMDLGTVKSRLQTGVYQDIASCAADIRLVFQNAMSYNPAGHAIHDAARSLLNEFELEFDTILDRLSRESDRKSTHSCTHCNGMSCQLCGEKCLKFEPPMLVCHGSCSQKIKRNMAYYVSTDGSKLYCQKCYGSLPHSSEVGRDEHGQPQILYRKSLLKRRFDEEVSEPWVQCEDCGEWVHQVCALFNDRFNDSGVVSELPRYTCPSCHLSALRRQQTHETNESAAEHQPPMAIEGVDSSSSPGERRPRDALPDAQPVKRHRSELSALTDHSEDATSPSCHASTLPDTRLGLFIERQVKHHLREQGFEDVADSVSVRLVSNLDGHMEVPDMIRDNLKGSDGMRVPQYLPYRSKCILLFQRIDGVDICLFSLYVQEFDQSCPEPNRGRVYVAYLDSVEYFRPREARTIVYHEILVSYLAWAKARGFHTAHIWACPPQKGDNFIFWCHPPYQKTPSRDRLNSWYDIMIERAARCGVVEDICNMYDEYFVGYNRREKDVDVWVKEIKQDEEGSAATRTPVCPPVFEGDFWVNECLRVHRLVEGRAKGMDGLDKNTNQRKCRDILKSIMCKHTSSPFNQPVDPVALNIPDYFIVITNPMDLGTARNKLRANAYPTILDFAEDIRLTFRNAMRYNPPLHPIHELAKSFLQEVENAFRDCVTERVGEVVSDADVDTWLARYPLTEQAIPASGVASPAMTSPESTLDDSCAETDTHVHDDHVDKPADCCSGSVCTAISDASQGPDGSHDHQEQDMQRDDDDDCSTDAESKDDDGNGRRGRMRRQMSVESEFSESTDCECSSSWGGSRRPFPSPHAFRFKPTAEETALHPFERPSLGVRGSLALMFELAKGVQRLRDDLFVLRLDRSKGAPPTTEVAGGSRVAKPKRKRESLYLPAMDAPGASHERRMLSLAGFDPECKRWLSQLTPDTTDPDPVTRTPIVDARHTFLEMCQFRHYQFDSLRRAKHSSMLLLYHLHHPLAQFLRPTCAHCKSAISRVRWHCDSCMNFDLCDACATQSSEPHTHALTPVRVTFD